MRKQSTRDNDNYRGALIAKWLLAAKQLCRAGNRKGKTEGSRLFADRDHYRHIRAFEGRRWIGWPVGRDCCCITTDFMVGLFYEDKKRLLKKPGNGSLFSPTGDLPVDVEIKSKGRISLTDALTIPTDILKGDEVMMVPRSRGLLEIWKLTRWQKHYSEQTGETEVEAEQVRKTEQLTH